MRNYDVLTSVELFEKMVEAITAVPDTPLGFDIETGYDGEPADKISLRPDHPRSKVVGFSFSADPRWARYVPLAHDSGPNMDPYETAPLLWRLLRSTQPVIQNARFEDRFLRKFFRKYLPDHPEVVATGGYFRDGITVHDTMIESYLLAETKTHGLKSLTHELLGEDQAEFLSLFPGVPKTKAHTVRTNDLDQTSPEVISYCCDDAALCLELHQMMYPRVKDHPLLVVEMAIQPILNEMEDYGVAFDWAGMARDTAQGTIVMDLLEAEIKEDFADYVGEDMSDLNLGSTKQLAVVLYEKMGIPSTVKTKGGAPSTAEAALTSLSERYPVVQKLLDWKGLQKLIGSYLSTWEAKFQYSDDGRTHPNHMQVSVPSGRFSVSDPPYQTCPKGFEYEAKGEVLKGDFRSFIIAPPEHYILGFDFSQVELRVMAGLSQEPTLLAAFNNDDDVHSATAAMLFGIPLHQVTKEQRGKGKTINFALLYGMSASSLAQRMRMSKEEGEALYDKYFDTFVSIRTWMNQMIAGSLSTGISMTPFGRKATLWDLQSSFPQVRKHAERLAVNHPVQGGAADYMKLVMIRVQRKIREAGLADRVHLVMNIHDALEWYVHDSVEYKGLIKLLMSEVSPSVPQFPKIRADWHVGKTWGTLTELEIIDGEIYPKGGAPVVTVAEPEAPTSPVSDQPEAPLVIHLPESAPAAPVDAAARIFTLTVASDMTEGQWNAFLDFLNARRDEVGSTLVVDALDSKVQVPGTYNMSEDDASYLSALLPGSQFAGQDRAVDNLLEGLVL